jgi:hypothetical protein
MRTLNREKSEPMPILSIEEILEFDFVILRKGGSDDGVPTFIMYV